MLAALRELEASWREREPYRAAGGARAMIGFDYQIAVALRHTVTSWLASPDEGGVDVVMESISDLSDLSSGLVVIQVKHRLTATNMRAALDELWRVWRLAEEVLGERANRIALKVICRAASGQVDKARAEWRPETGSDGLAAFQARVSIEQAPNPENQLIGLLGNELRAPNPLELIRKWKGLLIEASAYSDGFRRAARDIVGELYALQNRRDPMQLGFHVWTDSDQPPERLERGGFLTGQRPRLRHLVKGYFAPRPRIVEALADELAAWQRTLETDDAGFGLPVFWIGGRSGSGKSVVLLQLLAHLQRYGTQPVLWLRSEPELLPAALDWSLGFEPSAIVAVDDPYSPGKESDVATSWARAARVVDARIDGGYEAALPTIVCCGPSEQAERLKRDLADRVRVNVWRPPREDPLGLADLRAWYEARTGTRPPDVGDDNVLLVQLFFEWSVGATIDEFGQRFLSRVEAADPSGRLRDQLSRMLALNRLYVDYPSAALTHALAPEELDALEVLRGEHHIAAADDAGGSAVRLAHPHLANALFSSWYPPDLARVQRRDHLARALGDTYRFGASETHRVAPLVAIANEVARDSSGGDRRVDDGTDLILRAFREEVESQRSVAASAIEIRAWLTVRTRGRVADLEPDPVAEALAHAGGLAALDDQSRTLLILLVRSFEMLTSAEQQAALDVIHSLVVRLNGEGCAGLIRAAVQASDDSRFTELAFAWVRHRPADPRCTLLVDATLQRGGPAVLDRVIEQLEVMPPTAQWVLIATSALRRKNQQSELIIAWVSKHRRALWMAPALAELVAMGVPDALSMAWGWLDLYQRERRASYVLDALLKAGGLTDRLADYMHNWLATEPTDAGYVLEEVASRGDEAGLEIVRTWLEHHQADPSWSFVWKALCRSSELPADRALGRVWLAEAAEDDPSWGFVWQQMVEREPNDPSLRSQASDWLSAHQGSPGWGPVWSTLFALEPSPLLYDVGCEWLRSSAFDSGAWSYVFEALARRSLQPSLAELGMDWLTTQTNQGSAWSYVWQAMWEHRETAELRSLACQWLSGGEPGDRAWIAVLEGLSPGVDTVDAEFSAAAWLAQAWPSSTARGVWALLVRRVEAHRLSSAFVERVQGVPEDSRAWPFLQALVSRARSCEPAEVAPAALDWLRRGSPSEPGWLVLWGELTRRRPWPSDLDEAAEQALAQLPVRSEEFMDFWRDLPVGESRRLAARRATRWLIETSDGDGRWISVWMHTRREMPTRAVWWVAERWLERHRHAPEWPMVYASTLTASDSTATLSALGRSWLGQCPDSDGWGSVWVALWRDRPDETIREIGQAYVSQPRHSSTWHRVWQELAGAGYVTSAMHQALRSWLGSSQSWHRAVWPRMWLLAWDNSGSAELVTLAEQRAASGPGRGSVLFSAGRLAA